MSHEKCVKNKGHPSFIPANEFSMNHLPEKYRTRKVFQYIKNILTRTARVNVRYTSHERPDGYTFAKCRGTKIPHTGSGYVFSVLPGCLACRCPECLNSTRPQKTWWEVKVQTACHVVFNTEEATATEVNLFYNDDSQKGMKTLWGLEVSRKNPEEDWCELVCATHDADLARYLQTLAENVDQLVGIFSREEKDSERDLCVVVSHPHGQPKMVTVGKRLEWLKSYNSGISRFSSTYSADTCPGSSGAPVIVPSQNFSPSTHLWSWVLPHSAGTVQRGINTSGAGNGWI